MVEYSPELYFFSSKGIPIEIISPTGRDEASIEYYTNHILEMCSARNAIVSLNEGTKSNKEGLYEELKGRLKGAYTENIDGFFCPIICGLTSLMKFEEGKLSWILNPLSIDLESETVKSCFAIYTDAIKEMQYDPQKVGKSSFSYRLADIVMRNIIEEM